jgi:hypothetical protein
MDLRALLLIILSLVAGPLVVPSSATEIDIYPNDKENGILAPLAEDNRALNTIGQCVWSSLQNAGRQIGEEKLYNLTKDRRCQGGANPSDVHRVLTALGVKFEQATNKKDGYKLMHKGLTLGYPCLISYGRAHAINVVHYDPEANKVCIVNNHGDRFQTKYHTLEEFDRLFKGWVCVVYPPEEAVDKMQEWIIRERKIFMDFYAPDGRIPEVEE